MRFAVWLIPLSPSCISLFLMKDLLRSTRAGCLTLCPDWRRELRRAKEWIKDAVSGLAADMVVNPQVNAGQMAMAGGGSVTSTDMSGLVSAIKDAVSSVNGGSGDIVIPVYLGGTMLDEVIVNAQQRANLRSGGR